MAIVLGFAALLATLLGGGFALRYHDKLHLILGFSRGRCSASRSSTSCRNRST